MDIYHRDLSTNLERIRIAEKFTDITIKPGLGTKTFRCHRVILAAMSPYFETMFEAGLSESRTGEVELLLDDEICEAILSFIYTGIDVATMENAPSLLEAAHMMQIESLRASCLKFLQSNLREENCLNVMQTAYLHESTELYENARSLVLKSFNTVAESEEIGYLDKEQLISILKADNLNCSEERMVCGAALSWINADFDNRKEYIDEILHILVSFPVSIATMEAKLSTHFKTLEENPLFKEKFDYVRHSSRFYATLQKTESSEEAMVIIGGSEGGSNQSVMTFSFRQKKWFSLPPLPVDPGYNFAVCSDGLDMYVSGGTNNKVCLLRYNGETNEWLRYQDLLFPRQYHCMAVVDGSLYILGGCKSTNDPPIREVDMMSLTSLQWINKRIDLPTAVRSASLAVLDENVYLIGGIDADKKPVNIAQCMNAKNHYTLRIFYSLPEEAKLQSRVVTCGNQICIICKTGEIMLFTEKEKAREVGKVDQFPRKGFGVCEFEGKILIVGGEVKLQARKDMLQYNTEKAHTVVMQETLPVCLRNFAFTKIVVLRKHLQTECGTELMQI